MNLSQNTSFLQQTKDIADGSTLNTDELNKLIEQLAQSADNNAIDHVISLYQKRIIKNEQKIWQHSPSDTEIKQYQESFKLLEKLYELKNKDERYHFKIVIPVADRPQHLKQCLSSLLRLCQSYNYGGTTDNKFNKISVLIADDSRDEKNIQKHEIYCTEFTASGLAVEYFGLAEQLALVNDATDKNKELKQVVSDISNIKQLSDFSHKGASIMRNITYLKLNKNTTKENTLIYFIDSDQEFCISTTKSDKQYAINYFHYLNEIFSQQDISILTGKVVGDPPVSPSVMAGNFQLDIKNFLTEIEKIQPQAGCQFHQHQKNHKDDAAYHDMANLFGFTHNDKVFDYHCTLQTSHTNADCFHDFSDKLSHFFYGEHPTRKTYFNYEDGFTKTSPARTVYTGNYIIKHDALDYFIPFAPLKLRMAGPVLGRLLKSQLQHKFASANLPMLHNRTVAQTGESEFRPGVKNNTRGIDLGNEFIRQFYGDVLLFCVDELSKSDTALNESNKERIKATLEQTYKKIKYSYIEKHDAILQLKTQINTQLNKQQNWWNDSDKKTDLSIEALSNFNAFINNIQANFSENSDAYQQITLSKHTHKYLDKILCSLLQHESDLLNWNHHLND